MRIAITGGSGRIGSRIVERAAARGDSVISLDVVDPAEPVSGVAYRRMGMDDYDGLVAALAGCEAVVHMAAIPHPFDHPDHVVHNNNVVGSYNVMRAAVECGIRRICQASSVNALGLSYSRFATFDYFPIDEQHPTHAEDAYALSKWICEQQADSLVRRYEDLHIASMRFHWVVDDRATAVKRDQSDRETVMHLWAYTLRTPAADACLRSVEPGRFSGHEVFYIVEPETASDIPSLELARTHYPEVPIRGDLSGNRSFFDSSKAARILDWGK